jgi:hypothetical protein
LERKDTKGTSVKVACLPAEIKSGNIPNINRAETTTPQYLVCKFEFGGYCSLITNIKRG